MQDSAKIGMIAGWGRYPVYVARTLRDRGHEVHCLGVHGHADPVLSDICTTFQPVGLGKAGYGVRFFRRHGVTEATMVGKIHKRILFQPGFAWRQFPDWTTMRLFAPHFLTRRKNMEDDTLLTTVVDFFAERGVRFGPATDLIPELLVNAGQLTRRGPSSAQWKDIIFGWRLAKKMGELDVGQSVAVKNQAAMAVEAIEGTDECIRRAGQLCTSGGFTIVKTAKPKQDMRFDVPTIGLGTLETLAQAGGKVLAVEAGKTILIDDEEVVRFANKKGLIVVAVTPEMIQERAG